MTHQDVTLLYAFGFYGWNPETLALISQLASGLPGPCNMPKGPFMGHLDGYQDIRAVAAGRCLSIRAGKTCSIP